MDGSTELIDCKFQYDISKFRTSIEQRHYSLSSLIFIPVLTVETKIIYTCVLSFPTNNLLHSRIKIQPCHIYSIFISSFVYT